MLREALANRTALICSLLGDYTAAEDVVQESFLVVRQKIRPVEEGTSILAWCRAIVRLEVLRTYFCGSWLWEIEPECQKNTRIVTSEYSNTAEFSLL